MAVLLHSTLTSRVAPILGSIKSMGLPTILKVGETGTKVCNPFVTISREGRRRRRHTRRSTGGAPQRPQCRRTVVAKF